MNWQNTTSYQQSDKVRTPKTWRLISSEIRIVLTRHIHYPENAWVMTCHPWFNEAVISTGTSDEAKQKAIELVLDKLESAIRELKASIDHT